MFRSLPVILCVSACSSSFDLEVSASDSAVPVGESTVVKVVGTLDVPKHSTAWISVAYEPADDRDDDWVGSLTFEPMGANPSGTSEFLYPTDDNVAPEVLFDAIDDRPEDISVRWRLVCQEAGTYRLWISSIYATASGAPVNPNGNSNEIEIRCE